MRKVLTLWQVGERDMREGAAGLRGGAFCGRGEHLCRGRPVLGLPIAADGVDGEEGRRRGCSGRRSPRDPRSFSGARSVVRPTSLFSKIGRPRARRGSFGPDLDALIQKSDLRRGQIMSAFLLSFCTWHMRAGYTQRGSRNLEDEALTKRSKSDDTIELKVLLRCATESSDAGVSRLMLAITWVRRERTCAPARGLESSGRTLPHCARAR